MEGLQLEEGDMPENNRNEIRVLVVEDEEKIALSICKKISSRASEDGCGAEGQCGGYTDCFYQ